MYEIIMLGRVVGHAPNGTAAHRAALALSSRVICPVSYRLAGGDPWGETVCERGEIISGADHAEAEAAKRRMLDEAADPGSAFNRVLDAASRCERAPGSVGLAGSTGLATAHRYGPTHLCVWCGEHRQRHSATVRP